jgi:predicted aspartyl protease
MSENHLIFLPDAVAGYSVDNNIESLTIPLKRAGNLILIDAKVDSTPGNLVFDTGSSMLVLNAIYFRNESRSGGHVSGGITGSMGKVNRTVIGKLWISEVQYKNMQADVTDLGHIEQAKNTKILGLFGLSMLKNFEVVLDLQNNRLSLFRTDRNGIRTSKSSETVAFDLEIPFQEVQDLIFIEARIAAKRCTFCIDTGAETNVLSNDLSSKILNTLTVLRRIKLRGTGSQSTEALYCQMNDFSIGTNNFKDMNVLVTDLSHMKEAFGVYIDGMLGSDFLEKGVFHFNHAKGKIGIQLNKSKP